MGRERKEATKKRGVHTVGHTQLEHGGGGALITI